MRISFIAIFSYLVLQHQTFAGADATSVSSLSSSSSSSLDDETISSRNRSLNNVILFPRTNQHSIPAHDTFTNLNSLSSSSFHNHNIQQRQTTTLIGDDNWSPIGGTNGLIEEGGIGDVFGFSVDISNDGRTIIVGSPHAKGDNGDEDAGEVYLYRLSTDPVTGKETWVKPTFSDNNPNLAKGTGGEHTGYAVSLAQDDETIFAVGEPTFDNSRGRVRVFQLSGTSIDPPPSMTQLGNSILGFEENDNFGVSLDLSGDGKRIIIGATEGETEGEIASNGGFVQVFSLTENEEWVQDAIFKSTDYSVSTTAETQPTRFGVSVSISNDGSKVGIGASNGDGFAVLINLSGDSTDTPFTVVGVEGGNERLGRDIALSDDGNTFAVGSHRFNCSAADLGLCGLVQVWKNTPTGFVLSGEIYGTSEIKRCGRSIDLSDMDESTGGTIAVGCRGAVQIYSFDGINFTLQKTLSSFNDLDDFFGISLAMSNTHQALIVGAPGPKDPDPVEGTLIVGTASVFGNAAALSSSPSVVPSSATLVPAPTPTPTIALTFSPTLGKTESPTTKRIYVGQTTVKGKGKSKKSSKKGSKGKSTKGKKSKGKKSSKSKGKKGKKGKKRKKRG